MGRGIWLFLVAIFLVTSQISFADDLLPWQKIVLTEYTHIYTPDLVNVNIDWSNPSVVAFASLLSTGAPDNFVRTVTLDGGLMRSSHLTGDALRMTLCHETGHLAGLAPRKNVPLDGDGPVGPDGRSYFSSEGQADYYATTVCFRKITQEQNHPAFIDSYKVTPRLARLCKGDTLCLRSALAGKAFLEIAAKSGISFEAPDQTQVSETILDSYPDRQCRLDTLVAGSLNPPAARPSCWYFNSGN